MKQNFSFFAISIMFLAFVENWSKQTTFLLTLEFSIPQHFKQNGAITDLQRDGKECLSRNWMAVCQGLKTCADFIELDDLVQDLCFDHLIRLSTAIQAEQPG